MENSKLEKCLTPEISTVIFLTTNDEIYNNFTKFTVTVPLVLPKGKKETTEKFTKISQNSQ
jgi:hypothetical protein